ncbi:TetR/AcrR family transcriptional regulator [Bremerella sp. T1]|uniref:TetR/AcrR family transcriptional regulator n=1 Tax=Bremerella sp. TYQ1 TaxID=3119568 RepID=UPI001CD021C4|nr:CerR family C-terminal domain-containing protein [Bremerella volcania]UBM35345.1 CerR family C-terminal domain-containing protein [Bremerella volcania]
MKKRGATAGKQEESAKSTSTRDRLLEVAGQLFAEHGFDRTTSKEITEKAGTNIAAVNYHFNSLEGLYGAVIEEATRMLATTSHMQAAVEEQGDAQDKLRAFLGVFVRVLTSPASSSWRLRVLVREFTSPTLVDQTKYKKSRLQKMNILKRIVSELMELPEDHPAVGRSCINVMAPCFMLMLCDRPTLKRSFPKFGLKSDDAPDLVQHMLQFALAGIAAVANEAKKDEHG